MTAFAPMSAHEPCSSGRSRFSIRPLALAFAITVLITAFRAFGTVDSDVASQLWIAQRLDAGAHLYSDILEVNPPLWFWMAIPVDRVASLLNAPIETCLVVAVGILILLSLAATDPFLHDLAEKQRALLLGYVALTLSAMPWTHVGQREQLVLVGTLPYAALIAARRSGKSVPALVAVLIGAGAGLGFALKHYFLIVPALLELWLILGTCRRWRSVRPEILAMGAIGVFYAIAIALAAPEYLTRVVPLLTLTYGRFGGATWGAVCGPFGLLGMVLLGVVLTNVRLGATGEAQFASAMTIAAVGFAAIYLIQFKGWHYHAIPLIGCASVALAAFLVETRLAPFLNLVAPALLVLPFSLAFEEQRHPALPNRDLLEAISGLRPGDPVGFLTDEPAIPWSVTLQGRYRYASRYNALWLMPAVAHNELIGSPDRRLSRLGREIVSTTVDDFSCIRPKRIIISRPAPDDGTFDPLSFFLRDHRFGALLSHYRVRSRSSLETYELVSPLPRAVSHCVSGL